MQRVKFSCVDEKNLSPVCFLLTSLISNKSFSVFLAHLFPFQKIISAIFTATRNKLGMLWCSLYLSYSFTHIYISTHASSCAVLNMCLPIVLFISVVHI